MRPVCTHVMRRPVSRPVGMRAKKMRTRVVRPSSLLLLLLLLWRRTVPSSIKRIGLCRLGGTTTTRCRRWCRGSPWRRESIAFKRSHQSLGLNKSRLRLCKTRCRMRLQHVENSRRNDNIGIIIRVIVLLARSTTGRIMIPRRAGGTRGRRRRRRAATGPFIPSIPMVV